MTLSGVVLRKRVPAGRQDRHQLVDAVRAGVTGPDGGEPLSHEGGPPRRIGLQRRQVLLHLTAAPAHDEVLPRREQVLAIVPGRRQQRDAAGQGLEHPDGRDAGQQLHIEAPRHVDGRHVARENLRRRRVGQPTAVMGRVAVERLARLVGIAYAVDVERETGATGGAEQEVLQFAAAFAVAPIADPDEPMPLLFDRGRTEHMGIGGFVPDEDPLAPAPTPVDVGQGLAERQDPIVAVEVEGPHGIRVAHRTMVRIVKQEREAPAGFAGLPEGRHEGRRVPLVYDDEVGIGASLGGIELRRVAVRRQMRVMAPERVEPRLPGIAQEIVEAPGALRARRSIPRGRGGPTRSARRAGNARCRGSSRRAENA